MLFRLWVAWFRLVPSVNLCLHEDLHVVVLGLQLYHVEDGHLPGTSQSQAGLL